MAVGLDTSVVLRLLTGRPKAEAERARAYLEEAVAAGDLVLVTDLVLSEAYFALHHHYGVPKNDARELLQSFSAAGVVQTEPAAAANALGDSGGAGLVDRLIAVRHGSCNATTVTLDRRMAKLPGVRKL